MQSRKPPVGEHDPITQPIGVVIKRPIFSMRPRDFAISRTVDEKICERFYGDSGGDLSRRMPAHTISHDVDILFGEQKEIVFIMRALHPTWGTAGITNFHLSYQSPQE